MNNTSDLPQLCQRCGEEKPYTCSRFNTQWIGPNCDEIESVHPQYAEAKRIEQAAVAEGNYNFEGVGLPKDIKNKNL